MYGLHRFLSPVLDDRLPEFFFESGDQFEWVSERIADRVLDDVHQRFMAHVKDLVERELGRVVLGAHLVHPHAQDVDVERREHQDDVDAALFDFRAHQFEVLRGVHLNFALGLSDEHVLLRNGINSLFNSIEDIDATRDVLAAFDVAERFSSD